MLRAPIVDPRANVYESYDTIVGDSHDYKYQEILARRPDPRRPGKMEYPVDWQKTWTAEENLDYCERDEFGRRFGMKGKKVVYRHKADRHLARATVVGKKKRM